MTTARLLARTATAGALAVLALGALPSAASAQDAEPIGDLSIALTGPSSGTPGGTGSFVVQLSNVGQSAATRVRVDLELPAGLSVASIGAADEWTCVLGEMSCELQGGLPPGDSAPPLPVEIAYAQDARDSKDVLAHAYQGEGSTAVRVDRAVATVVLTAPAAPPAEPPTAVPAAQPPAPASAPTTAARPAPVRAAARTVTTTTRSTPAPAAAPEAEPVAEAETVAAAAEQAAVPESLPFVEDTASPAPAEQTRDVALAARPVADDGVDGWLVGVFCAAFLAFSYCVVAAIAKSRRA